MAIITDDYMKEMIALTKNYVVVILRHGPNYLMPGVEKIIWEHGRRNFLLKSEGKLPIVCPVTDNSELNGVGIFIGSEEEVKQIRDEDPGVKEGVFIYELHSCRGFPGDSLP
jgi:hypothetical protein